ncbi:hypothetical protein ColTof4_00134 [Colletotrichum tofieldiae]|nr:hypothetical protein ColTof3_07332 [Colletotrichum tofieldiae]GKT67711.1 hypothetical protein ColTof4_00134 [Colletotrichum tofieldiae]
MRVSSFLALASAAFVAAGPGHVPEDAESYVLAGPLPYKELKTEVAKLKSDGESNVARSLNKRICEFRNLEGVLTPLCKLTEKKSFLTAELIYLGAWSHPQSLPLLGQ